jgi:hypothetical protein
MAICGVKIITLLHAFENGFAKAQPPTRAGIYKRR